MTWQDYKTWLEANILEKETILEEEVTVLRESVADKYSLGNLSSQEEALIKALDNLILSIENNDSSSSYHVLPEFKELKDDNQFQKWEELFPDRTTVFFGKKDNNKIFNDKTWTTLTTIFNDWQQEETRAEKLAKELNEDEIAKEFLIKTAIHFNYKLLKKGDYEQKLVNWLTEYKKLGQEKQESLSKHKEQAEKLLQCLQEESQSNQSSTSKLGWFSEQDWWTIGMYSLAGLLGLLIVGWIASKLKGKD